MRLDLPMIRRALEEHGRAKSDVADLHVTHIRPGDDGPILIQLASSHVDGSVETFTVRSVEEARGNRWAAQINSRVCHDAAPAVYDARLKALVTSFPADRRLTNLSLALDGTVMRRVLSDHFVSRGVHGGLDACRSSVVRYKSESKCVIRYELDWRSRHATRPAVLYGKVSKRSIFERSKIAAEFAAELGASSGFETAAWFGTIEPLSLELWGELRGVPLVDVSRRRAVDVAYAAGQALHSLHALRWDLPVQRREDNIGLALKDATRHLSKARPDMAENLMTLMERLTPALRWSETQEHSPTHHDFHGHNLLIDQTTIGLLDFEDLSQGDRFHDVGALLAHLIELETQTAGATINYKNQRAAFLAGYGALDSAEADRLATYAAAHCVLRGFQALRKPNSADQQSIEALVRVAMRFLQGENP